MATEAELELELKQHLAALDEVMKDSTPGSKRKLLSEKTDVYKSLAGLKMAKLHASNRQVVQVTGEVERGDSNASGSSKNNSSSRRGEGAKVLAISSALQADNHGGYLMFTHPHASLHRGPYGCRRAEGKAKPRVLCAAALCCHQPSGHEGRGAVLYKQRQRCDAGEGRRDGLWGTRKGDGVEAGVACLGVLCRSGMCVGGLMHGGTTGSPTYGLGRPCELKRGR